MKKRIQIALLHIVVGVLLFLGACVFFNYQMTARKGSPVAELAGSTYPVMSIESDNAEYNLMKAYRGEIDLSLVRNQISVLDDSGNLKIRLYCYEYDITAVQYTLFKEDPKDPLEEGTINQLQSEEDTQSRYGVIHFDSDLKEGENYFLRMAVRLDNNTRAWFYTRLQNGPSRYNDYLEFAVDFHDTILEKGKAQDKIGIYLESDASQTARSMEHVDIHSSMDRITYGSMTVKEEQKPRMKIREINNTYAVVEITTVLSSEVRSDLIQYYDVRETYKLRYSAERMFLLDYHRYMDARYNPEFIDSTSNYIGLGIQTSDNISYVSSEDGYRLAFVDQGQLWYYDYKSSNAVRVYSFTTENLSDLRNDQDEHGIRILDMDKNGNITYLIYGYMSRGRHEGANGIQILYYDSGTNCNEERAFLVTSVPYSSIEEDLNRLSYYNGEGMFYCCLEGDLHEIDIAGRKDKILRSGLVNERLTASGDQSIIAVEKKGDITENTEIEMTSLENGLSRTFRCEGNERIRSVGFLNDDFIYGTSDADDIYRDESGAVFFPLSKLHIVDIEGNEIRQYSKKKRYITQTSISGSVLEMEFARKQDNRFIKSSDRDYIRYKEEKTTRVSLASKQSDTFGEQMYFSFPDYVYIQVEPDLILTKIKTSEDDNTMELSRSNEEADQYYVYADGEKKATYTNLPDAVRKATELRGNVFDNREHMIWQCAFDEYNIVPGMDRVLRVDNDQLSLAGCLSMIASLNGKNMSPDEIDRKPGMPAALLEMCSGHKTLTLTGCTVDDVLYYVSQGSPVLAKYSASKYVIVMSYNSTKIRYLDPVTGQSLAVSRKELSDIFAKQGNIFYSYLAE